MVITSHADASAPSRPTAAPGDPERPVCAVCGGGRFRPLHRRLDDPRAPAAGQHDVLACRSCGAARTWPVPGPDRLAALYRQTYAPPEAPVEPAEIAAASAALAAGHPGPADWWRRLGAVDVPALLHLPPTAPLLPRGGRALDVGAHVGETLLWLRAAGYEAVGLEPNPEAAASARRLGFEVVDAPLEAADLPGQSFDLAVLSCVIEHLRDPAEGLRRLHAALRPGGRLLLTTHNLSSVWRHLFGRRWINWHPPFHLHHFGPAALQRLAGAAGFRTCHLGSRSPAYWVYFSWCAWRGAAVTPPADPAALARLGRVLAGLDRLLPGDCQIGIFERPR